MWQAQATKLLRNDLRKLTAEATKVLDWIDSDASIDADSIDNICTVFSELADLEQGVRDFVARVHKTTESFKTRRIIDKLDEMGVDKVSVPSLGRSFYPKTRYSASMIDREAGMAWLRENGASDMITETVNHNTLTAFVKSMVADQGIEPPADIFKFGGHRYIGSSAYTPKG